MIREFDRKYSIIAINHPKLKEFKYCVLTYSGDINQLLAQELISNNKILSYLRDNDKSNLEFLRENLKDKLNKLKQGTESGKSGYSKNDGIYMNFLAYAALKESYSVDPLYLLQRSDVENPKFGVDSVFYVDNAIWIFEFKTSTLRLTEETSATKVKQGVESLFCNGDIKIASLYDCRANINSRKLSQELVSVINALIDGRNDTKKILGIEGLHFNVCIVSPSSSFDNAKIKQHISEKYLTCDDCEAKGKECKSYKCPKYKEIKIDNVFHLQLPTDFSLENLYDMLIKMIGENIHESD